MREGRECKNGPIFGGMALYENDCLSFDYNFLLTKDSGPASRYAPSNFLLECGVFIDESLGFHQVIRQLIRGGRRLSLDQPGQKQVQVLMRCSNRGILLFSNTERLVELSWWITPKCVVDYFFILWIICSHCWLLSWKRSHCSNCMTLFRKIGPEVTHGFEHE